MMGVLYDKKQMTEEDIKLKFITPAITRSFPDTSTAR